MTQYGSGKKETVRKMRDKTSHRFLKEYGEDVTLVSEKKRLMEVQSINYRNPKFIKSCEYV